MLNRLLKKGDKIRIEIIQYRDFSEKFIDENIKKNGIWKVYQDMDTIGYVKLESDEPRQIYWGHTMSGQSKVTYIDSLPDELFEV